MLSRWLGSASVLSVKLKPPAASHAFDSVTFTEDFAAAGIEAVATGGPAPFSGVNPSEQSFGANEPVGATVSVRSPVVRLVMATFAVHP